MQNNLNPFSLRKPELMANDIIDYFVEPHFLNVLIGENPIMIIGARGTGKTTLFKYLAYDSQHKLNGKDLSFVGIYWKVDINYVSGFYESGITSNEWVKIFGHYVNITLCMELCRIVQEIQSIYSCISNELMICENVLNTFGSTLNGSTFIDLYHHLKKLRNDIENYVNNTTLVPRPLLSTLERPIQEFCNSLEKEEFFKGKWFYFLIDEYENLSEYQQRIINTLIKHSQFPYTFKACRRPFGDKTPQTLKDTETLSDPDDYTIIDLSIQMSDKKKYSEFARKVCNKRLEKITSLVLLGKTDICDFLPELHPIEEVNQLEKKRSELPYVEKLKRIVNEDFSITDDQKELVFETFLSEQNPIIRRLCLSIIQRGKFSTKDVYEEYLLYKSGKPSNFTQNKEWIHNNKTGILFLLCSEYETPKKYCGFNTFVNLSSGVIRYLIELCNVTFYMASQRGFSFDNPKQIDFDTQNKAARFVAEKYLSQINTKAPFGNLLRTFVLTLGRIFQLFHKDDKQSEPEKNQFTTDSDKLDSEVQMLLEFAVMTSVLIERTGTQEKGKSDIKDRDYMLHPIFSPKFQISTNIGRKLKLTAAQLKQLFEEGEAGRKALINTLFISNSDEEIQQKLF